MDKQYDHTKYESDIYKKWEESGVFSPKVDKSKKPFTITMPPPNANDPLHIGHAMFVTIEDILIRYHRMLGDSTLWLPGTDHAGIETQYVFEKKLAKEDKSRFDFDRDTFYKMVWDYVQENSDVAIDQMKKLGASADWSRYKFTLDPDVVDFVLNTFEKLHDDGLVYRGERLVNYCTKCGTGYSDLEVEYEDRIDSLYFVKYELVDEPGKFIVVATTRPEPIWVDTHLAIHPEDKKNNHLVGKKVKNPLTDSEMEIIADEFVDPEFGTGIVKLTPAHDANDFAAAEKHSLPIIQAIGTDGKMIGGPSEGKKVSVAREEAVSILQEKGLIERIDDKYNHRVATCYRCHSVIEPLPLAQFFIKVKPLAEGALKALDNGETKILGTGREKILRDWLTNLKDWNISRQVIWGIRIPVWYDVEKNPDIEVGFLNHKEEFIKGKVSELLKEYSFDNIESGLQTLHANKDTEFVISKEKPEGKFLQETDSFDTWFSSGQWPVVTLKTNKENDFETFYPTSVMETAYEILPFWVMRMMMLGIYLTGRSPFEHVYLHGLVRDEQGRKMSKSVGNVVNPLELTEKYGTDALRVALVMSSTPGQDKNVGENQIKGMRNFSNKIWNAARFASANRQNTNSENKDYDDAFYKKLNEVTKNITQQLDDLKIGLAAETVYNEFWHWFCDVCIEENKEGKISDEALMKGLKTFLKLLHPFVPFVTEAVWSEMGFDGLLINSSWPRPVKP